MSAIRNSMVLGERNAVRHALTAERARVRHCHDALAGTQDRKLQWRWNRRMESSIDRAARLALTLVDMGEAVPMEDASPELDGYLLEAMDLVLRSGGMPATGTLPCGRAIHARSVRNVRRRM